MKTDKKKAIFLDRDGTLNVEVDYLHEREKMELIPGTVEALRILQDKGYLLIVVTNQSGVARGYFTMREVNEVNEYMEECLSKDGILIQKFYCCPHGANDQCNCRKPKTGLYEQAIKEYNIDASRSYLVGDKVTDILAAEPLGAKYGLLLSGHDIEQELLEKYQDSCYSNLLEFAQSI